jgi:hypothetical protein
MDSAVAKQILMKEYKTLSKEPWTHIEVRQRLFLAPLFATSQKSYMLTVMNTADKRQYSTLESSPHRPQPRFRVPRRLLCRLHELSHQLPHESA